MNIRAKNPKRRYAWIAYLSGADWGDQVGKVSLETLRVVEQLTRGLPKGPMRALVGGPWGELATIPDGWVRPKGPTVAHRAGKMYLAEVSQHRVEQLTGKGVTFAFETTERGAKDYSLTQQCVIMARDGSPGRPEYTSGHPWDRGGPGPSKIQVHLRADHVNMEIVASELHQSLLSSGLPLAGALWGCIDAFTMKQSRCGSSFDRPLDAVDHDINNMMWEWVHPETDRRRLISAVFWGNLWCPSFIERLGVAPQDLVAKAYAEAGVANALRPLFSRLADGTVIWTMTDGPLAELLTAPVHEKIMAAKRALTGMLNSMEATVHTEPYIGPELPGLPQTLSPPPRPRRQKKRP